MRISSYCRWALGLPACVALLAACMGSPMSGGPGATGISNPLLPKAAVPDPRHRFALGSAAISHVVIIIQENRTVDNLFNALPGADTAQAGQNSTGQSIALQPELLTAPYDLSHRHPAWTADYANGSMNGFAKEPSKCKRGSSCLRADVRAYAYVPPEEVQPYYRMAQTYTFADKMFETNQGPSFPAHQYLISGTSAIADGSDLLASENPHTSAGKPAGGCDSPPGATVAVIDRRGDEGQSVYPCFARTALMNELDAAGLTWHYYQQNAGPGLWNAVDAIRPIWHTPGYANVIYPSAQVLTDISNGKLANVTWITPSGKSSDHAGATDGSGPSWVASIANAIGASPYWRSTAIFVVWDDWGGWYDHVKPPLYNSYELGFRVPLLVISPFAKRGYISHTQHEFGSILHFTEENFGLPSMGTTDARADDLSDCFNFGQTPIPFVAIPAPLRAQYFRNQRDSPNDVPDTDQ
ncbi:MAG: alkaline phosphatase family protein [Candidatus Cybelea sp.]